MTAPATVVFTLFFFFNDTATTEIYTLSLHDALPIFRCGSCAAARSRYLTSICGCAARHRDTISRVRVRLAEFSPRMLESMCSSFTALSPIQFLPALKPNGQDNT